VTEISVITLPGGSKAEAFARSVVEGVGDALAVGVGEVSEGCAL